MKKCLPEQNELSFPVCQVQLEASLDARQAGFQDLLRFQHVVAHIFRLSERLPLQSARVRRVRFEKTIRLLYNKRFTMFTNENHVPLALARKTRTGPIR